MDKMTYNEMFEYKDGFLYNKYTRGSSAVKGAKAGYIRKDKYHGVKIHGKEHLTHRIIWTMINGVIPKGICIDHINNNEGDNRIENLQLITNEKNSQRRTDSKGYTIVDKSKHEFPYLAQKGHKSKRHHIGMYGTPGGAYMANRMFFITHAN